MWSAKGLREEFDKDMQWLQDNCKHEKSEWMGEEWAPGHGTGRVVKVCDCCEKIVESTDVRKPNQHIQLN